MLSHVAPIQTGAATDPEADQILRSCVRYGFCTATCPTFVLTRDENDGPRGRIELMRTMLASDEPPDPRTVHYLDRCLSCLGCMSTCAVSIDYMHLIDIARDHIERHHTRPLVDRLARALIAGTIPHPARMRLAMLAARLGRPLAGLMPKALRAMVDMVPPAQPAPEPLAVGVHPARGQRRLRVALLPGCAQQVLDGGINAATLRLLTRAGCEVVVLRSLGCCGALTLHMGKTEHGRNLARLNVTALVAERDRAGIDAIVSNASGCGTAVKDYGHLFADERDMASAAKWVSSHTRDVCELVAELGLPSGGDKRHYRVAYHDACSLRHGQRVVSQPRALLRDAGYEVVDVPEAHLCCGSAGAYNMLQPEIAGELGLRKAGHIASTKPQIATMGNIGCLTQLRRHGDVPTVHTVELLDWATGGPMPPRLQGVALELARPAATAASADFW